MDCLVRTCKEKTSEMKQSMNWPWVVFIRQCQSSDFWIRSKACLTYYCVYITYFTSWKKQTNRQFSQSTWCSVATHGTYYISYILYTGDNFMLYDSWYSSNNFLQNCKHGDLVFVDPSISTSSMFCSRTPYERGLDRDAGCPAPHRRIQRQLGSKQQWPPKQNWAVIKTHIYDMSSVMVGYYGSLEWLKAPISLGSMARSLFDKLIAVVWKKDKWYIATKDSQMWSKYIKVWSWHWIRWWWWQYVTVAIVK